MTSPLPEKLPLWRSVLFVPAHVKRYVDAAHTRGADAIQLDLEDSVPLDGKEAGRAVLGDAIKQLGEHPVDVLVRINRDLRNTVRDLECAIVAGVSAISLPKVQGADHLRLIDELMTELERERGLPVGGIRLIAMVETLGALAGVEAMARACPRLAGLTLGSEDLSADGGFEPTPDNLFHPCQRLVFAAKAAGLHAYGFPGSIAEFGDLDAYRQQVQRGRSMGFDGAFCIHPKQVDILNQVFQPTAEEVAQAQQVLAAYEAAMADNRGAATLDGKMIDLPVVQRARRVLGR